jgi:hypothetical protein
VWLKMHNSGALEDTVQALHDPASARFQAWASDAAIDAAHAPTAAEVATVSRFLSSAGLTVTGVGPHNLFVSARGTAAQVQAALKVELREFALGDRTFFANTAAPSLPSQELAAHSPTSTRCSPDSVRARGTESRGTARPAPARPVPAVDVHAGRRYPLVDFGLPSLHAGRDLLFMLGREILESESSAGADTDPDPRGQPTTANGEQHGVNVRLCHQLATQRPLSGDDLGLVVRMHEHRARRRSVTQARVVRVGIHGARHGDGGAQGADPVDLDRGRGLRHEDPRRYAELVGHVGDGQTVVPT